MLATKVEDLQKAAQEWVQKPCPLIIDARIERAVGTLPYRRIRYGRDEQLEPFAMNLELRKARLLKIC